MRVSGQRHAPALYPRKTTPCTHWTGGWVSPRAGLDADARKNHSPLPRIEFQSVVRHYTDLATPILDKYITIIKLN
jgi:hypothetical protein